MVNSLRPRFRPAILRFLTGVAVSAVPLVAILMAGAPASAATRASSVSPSSNTADLQDATAAYASLQQDLYQPSISLYEGLPSNSCDPYSCLWPFTNATAGTVFLLGIPGKGQYSTDVAARFTGLSHYADAKEVSPTGATQPPAYESAVAPPLGPGGATYYDDNGWVGLDLVHAYLLTSNTADLVLAQDEFNYAISGWDTSSSDGCPGGVFWEDASGSQRNATANGANSELGLELDQLTGNKSDLSWATRMYQWVRTCLGTSTGLYNDHVNPGGSVNTTIWSYNQGVMVGAGVLLYKLTGTSSYLTQAQVTASAAVSYFGTGTTLVNQGPAFDAIYFRDLFFLNEVTPNSSYATEAQSFASYMWSQRQASTGLIDPQYGVNGTAPMVEIFALLAGSPPTP
jgi:hypothetical protein